MEKLKSDEIITRTLTNNDYHSYREKTNALILQKIYKFILIYDVNLYILHRRALMIRRRIWLYIDPNTSSFSLASLEIIYDHRFLHVIWELFFWGDRNFQRSPFFLKMILLRFSIMKDTNKEYLAYLTCDHQLSSLHIKNIHHLLQWFF